MSGSKDNGAGVGGGNAFGDGDVLRPYQEAVEEAISRVKEAQEWVDTLNSIVKDLTKKQLRESLTSDEKGRLATAKAELATAKAELATAEAKLATAKAELATAEAKKNGTYEGDEKKRLDKELSKANDFLRKLISPDSYVPSVKVTPPTNQGGVIIFLRELFNPQSVIATSKSQYGFEGLLDMIQAKYGRILENTRFYVRVCRDNTGSIENHETIRDIDGFNSFFAGYTGRSVNFYLVEAPDSPPPAQPLGARDLPLPIPDDFSPSVSDEPAPTCVKERDGGVCVACGQEAALQGAHILDCGYEEMYWGDAKNVAHGRENPDPRVIVSLCPNCHCDYDSSAFVFYRIVKKSGESYAYGVLVLRVVNENLRRVARGRHISFNPELAPFPELFVMKALTRFHVHCDDCKRDLTWAGWDKHMSSKAHAKKPKSRPLPRIPGCDKNCWNGGEDAEALYRHALSKHYHELYPQVILEDAIPHSPPATPPRNTASIISSGFGVHAANTDDWLTMIESQDAEKELLDRVAESNGLRVIDVGGGGDCQFRALAHEIFGTEDLYQMIRAGVADRLLKNQTDYDESMLIDVPGLNNIQAYAESVRDTHAYGGYLSLQAFADAYNVEVYVIITVDGGSAALFSPNSGNGTRVLVVGYLNTGEGHYVCFEPLRKEELESHENE